MPPRSFRGTAPGSLMDDPLDWSFLDVSQSGCVSVCLCLTVFVMMRYKPNLFVNNLT